jgi:hypothetical protein
MNNEVELKKFWLTVTAYYRQTVENFVIALYAEDCKDVSLVDLKRAFDSHRKSARGSFMPLPMQLIAIINPEVDENAEANEVPSKIFEAISRFGYNHSQQAREYVGELAWSCVEGFGGWYHLCTSSDLGSESTVRAQLRDAAKSKIIREKNGRALQAPGIGLVPSIENRRETLQLDSGSASKLASLAEILAAKKELV